MCLAHLRLNHGRVYIICLVFVWRSSVSASGGKELNMDVKLQIFLLTLLLIQILLIIWTIRTRKMSMRFGSLWIVLILAMAWIVIFPQFILRLSTCFGFEVPSNMLFLLGFFFVLSMIFMLTASISALNEKMKLLIQEISLIKKCVDQYGKKK